MLQIQDNTGKDSNGKPIKVDGKSLSSIFAQIRLSKDQRSIKGSELVELLKLSRQDKKEKFLNDFPPRTVAQASFSKKSDKQKRGEAWKPSAFEEKDEEMEELKAVASTTFAKTITTNDTTSNTASSPVSNTLTVATSVTHISSAEASVSKHINGVVTGSSLSEDLLSTHDYTPQDIAHLVHVNLGTGWTRANIGDPELGNPIYYTLFRRNDLAHQQIIFPPVTLLQNRDLRESLKDM